MSTYLRVPFFFAVVFVALAVTQGIGHHPGRAIADLLTASLWLLLGAGDVEREDVQRQLGRALYEEARRLGKTRRWSR